MKVRYGCDHRTRDKGSLVPKGNFAAAGLGFPLPLRIGNS